MRFERVFWVKVATGLREVVNVGARCEREVERLRLVAAVANRHAKLVRKAKMHQPFSDGATNDVIRREISATLPLRAQVKHPLIRVTVRQDIVMKAR